MEKNILFVNIPAAVTEEAAFMRACRLNVQTRILLDSFREICHSKFTNTPVYTVLPGTLQETMLLKCSPYVLYADARITLFVLFFVVV